MNVYILGIDGYIGWPLYEHLTAKGHNVRGCDSWRRRKVTKSLIPLNHNKDVICSLNVMDNDALTAELRNFKPDAIVHLAEEPSAPYSMQSLAAAIETQTNNVMGSLSVIYAMREACPSAHLIKLGSLGEYIPSSWYHLSKVHDTNNLKWACKVWGLTATDIMQGPVYGVGGRFDYDHLWGTVINRFVAQAVAGVPLTVYGSGEQIRGFLPIQDSLQCIEIILNQRIRGEKSYLTIDQYAEASTINEIALIVNRFTDCDITYIENPRVESIKAENGLGNKWLLDHGYLPEGNLLTNIKDLIEEITPFKDNIDIEKFEPRVRWR